jgi:hypothetical protein
VSNRHTSLIAPRASLHHGVQVVLRLQNVPHPGVVGQQADPAKAPFGGPVLVQQIVGVHRLVRPVESTDAHVNDAFAYLSAVVQRHPDARA